MTPRSGDPGRRTRAGSASRAAPSAAKSAEPPGRAGSRGSSRTGRNAARAVRLRKVYGSGQTAVPALRDVDVEFPRGRFTAIMGPSGSGKSTLMHCMAGLDTISRGRVFIGDVDLSRLSDKQLTQLRRDRIGFIFQQFNLLPTLTAAENITLPLDIAGRRPDKKWMREVVDAVGLAPRLRHRPTELSGGQQQRVACARALVTRPDIVFADEPTGNLDSKSGAEVLGFLQASVRDFGQTIVMVTHDATAASYSDEVIFLADGRIVDSLPNPTADEVLDRMKHLDSDDEDLYYDEDDPGYDPAAYDEQQYDNRQYGGADYDGSQYGSSQYDEQQYGSSQYGDAAGNPYAYDTTGYTGEFPAPDLNGRGPGPAPGSGRTGLGTDGPGPGGRRGDEWA
jgi:putative ABC transport system ATP-binding protein